MTPLPVVPPANLTTACSEPEALAAPVTIGDLLRFTVNEVQRGQECRARHQALTDWASEKR